MEFEWDENKNHSNIIKHSINFETAIEAFNDPFATIKFDRNINNELRLHLIAKIRNTIIVLVVFTKRNHKFRIISVRKANKKERNEYYEKNE